MKLRLLLVYCLIFVHWCTVGMEITPENDRETLLAKEMIKSDDQVLQVIDLEKDEDIRQKKINEYLADDVVIEVIRCVVSDYNGEVYTKEQIRPFLNLTDYLHKRDANDIYKKWRHLLDQTSLDNLQNLNIQEAATNIKLKKTILPHALPDSVFSAYSPRANIYDINTCLGRLLCCVCICNVKFFDEGRPGLSD